MGAGGGDAGRLHSLTSGGVKDETVRAEGEAERAGAPSSALRGADPLWAPGARRSSRGVRGAEVGPSARPRRPRGALARSAASGEPLRRLVRERRAAAVSAEDQMEASCRPSASTV